MAPDDIETAVLEGQVALGVGVFHIHKPGLAYVEICIEFMGLYCGAGHPLFDATRPDVQEELLRNAPMARRAYLKEEQFAPISRGRPSNAAAHQVEGIALLILTGSYIGHLPHSFAERWLEKGRMKSGMDGRYDLPTSIEIVTRRDATLTPVSETFIRLLKA